ncbi:MAG: hypothetical protein ACREDU_02725 [Methylocella sp.]
MRHAEKWLFERNPSICFPLLNLPLARHALVEVSSAELGQLLDLVLEKVVGAGDHLVLDDNAFLRLELGNETVNGFGRRDSVLLAVKEQASPVMTPAASIPRLIHQLVLADPRHHGAEFDSAPG